MPSRHFWAEKVSCHPSYIYIYILGNKVPELCSLHPILRCASCLSFQRLLPILLLEFCTASTAAGCTRHTCTPITSNESCLAITGGYPCGRKKALVDSSVIPGLQSGSKSTCIAAAIKSYKPHSQSLNEEHIYPHCHTCYCHWNV